MNLKLLGGLLMATVCGFFGGAIGTFSRVQALQPDVVRASQYELIGPGGKRCGLWQVNSRGESRISIFSNEGLEALDIGLLGTGGPMLRMRGKDGKNRVAIQLDGLDKPVIVLSDERWEGRVVLGYDEPDVESPEWDNWILKFCIPGSERGVAGMGLTKVGTKWSGFVGANGRRIH